MSQSEMTRLCWRHTLALRWARASGTPLQWRDAGRESALEAAKACRRCRRLNDWPVLALGEMAEILAARRFTTTAWVSGLAVFGVLFLMPFYSPLFCAAVSFVPLVVLTGIGLWMRGAPDLGRGLVVGAVMALLSVLGMILIGLAKYGT